jgi:8-oxo-dGTP pyrophosphatase MutT (NUDIX family)
MQFDEVVRRLARIPAQLPEPPEALVPMLVETGAGIPIELRRPPEPADAVPAAVLVLFHPGVDGEARVVLTERVDRGGHHAGEVSLPGGKAEPGDADLEATAIRESEEEVGLDRRAAGVRILGRLEPFSIPVSGYRVTPIVAVADRAPVLRPQPSEVARIVHAPIAGFLPSAAIVIVERTIRGWPLRYGAYPVDDLLVWGATARILGQLGAILGSDG